MPTRIAFLDIDGTLVDSNDSHAQAWVDALADFGRPVPFPKIRSLVGMGGDNLLPEVAGLSADEGEGLKIAEHRARVFKERYLEKIRAFPGSRLLLERLRERGLRLMAATSSEEDVMHRLLEIAGVADLMQQTTSSDDAERSKPAPDIVQAALQRAGVRPDEAVMIGDTPYDVTAAARAGVRAIAFRCGGWSDPDLAGAIEVYDGPWELAEKLSGGRGAASILTDA